MFQGKGPALSFFGQMEAVQSSRMLMYGGSDNLRELMADISEVLFDAVNTFWGDSCSIIGLNLF